MTDEELLERSLEQLKPLTDEEVANVKANALRLAKVGNLRQKEISVIVLKAIQMDYERYRDINWIIGDLLDNGEPYLDYVKAETETGKAEEADRKRDEG